MIEKKVGRTSLGLDQKWQIDAGNGRRAWRRLGIDGRDGRKHRHNRSGRTRGDEIESQNGMIWRLGRYQMLATWKRAFTAIVGVRGRDASALFAAGRGFLGK